MSFNGCFFSQQIEYGYISNINIIPIVSTCNYLINSIANHTMFIRFIVSLLLNFIIFMPTSYLNMKIFDSKQKFMMYGSIEIIIINLI